MRFKLAIAAALGLILAPAAAYAQAKCSDVTRINAEALDDFDNITGEELDDDYYKATYTMPGASECTIDYYVDSVYSCLWIYDSYASAATAEKAQAAIVGSCLSGWKIETLSAETEAKDDLRTLAGVRYEGEGEFEDMEWTVTLEEHTADGGKHYDLWVELASFWF